MKNVNLEKFQKLLLDFKAIPTFTKQKYNLMNILLDYIKSCENISYESNYGNFGIPNATWAYEIVNVPLNKNGHLKTYRGLKVVIFAIGRNQYKRTVICFPI